MSKELKRLTTEYVELEDRIRLSGELEPDQPLVIWLTQRMLYRLVPVLVDWLQAQVDNSPVVASNKMGSVAATAGVKDFMLQAAQQAAKGSVTPQPPVRAASDSPTWLAKAVDVSHSPQALRLTIRGQGADQQVHLPMNAQLLRQWLSILQAGTQRAGWPQTLWPEWMQTPQPPQEPRALH